jgi:hypothetical protein
MERLVRGTHGADHLARPVDDGDGLADAHDVQMLPIAAGEELVEAEPCNAGGTWYLINEQRGGQSEVIQAPASCRIVRVPARRKRARSGVGLNKTCADQKQRGANVG